MYSSLVIQKQTLKGCVHLCLRCKQTQKQKYKIHGFGQLAGIKIPEATPPVIIKDVRTEDVTPVNDLICINEWPIKSAVKIVT